MSEYLVRRILEADNVEVRLHTEVVAALGDGHLESITLADRDTGTEQEVPTSWLFVFIGASPRTGWLGYEFARDAKGFVVTGPICSCPPTPATGHSPDLPTHWRPAHQGCSPPATSGWMMKRVASAVGEGAMSVYLCIATWRPCKWGTPTSSEVSCCSTASTTPS